MNKSLITNLITFCLIIIGYLLSQPVLLTIGLFAFSGALTNWLAVHMLFEKIPGLYGSGIIPARFEDFKTAIRNMLMEQFFTDENIDKFLSHQQNSAISLNLEPVIQKVDLSPAFNSLLQVIMNSSFGGMLGMLGGQEALLPLKEPFISSMKESLADMTRQTEFQALLKSELEQPEVMSDIKQKVLMIIDSRLLELTPQIVKQIIQKMIKQHLGWLVVWGGVFGGLIGGLSTLISI